MKLIKLANIFLKIMIFFFLVVLISGLSYAYFLSIVNNSEETSTLTASGGILTINYVGGATLTAVDIMPSNTPFITKNFTIVGNARTTDTMNYHVVIVVDINTFSFDAIKYKLTSTNTHSNGAVIPAVTTMAGVGAGLREVPLGSGHFTGTSGVNKSHTYKLEMIFPNLSTDQSFDQDRFFSAHLETREGIAPTNNYLTDKIIGQYGGATNITEAPASLFEDISTESENAMYTAEDDYGTSYYYRGAKTLLNNNLIFANHQWKIVRINGDGSIRLIYNGSCPGNSCSINDTGTSTDMGESPFNSNVGDAKYSGYMHGNMATPTTTREGAEANEVSSTIKTFLDSWYANNIQGTEYESYISDTLFCSDRQLRSEVGGPATGPGFGSSLTYYASRQRNYTLKAPSLKCGRKHDRFTVSDTTVGNGALTYPIGLITVDETSMAGLK